MQKEIQPNTIQLKSHRQAQLEHLKALQRQRQALSEVITSLDQQINELLAELIPPGEGWIFNLWFWRLCLLVPGAYLRPGFCGYRRWQRLGSAVLAGVLSWNWGCLPFCAPLILRKQRAKVVDGIFATKGNPA